MRKSSYSLLLFLFMTGGVFYTESMRSKPSLPADVPFKHVIIDADFAGGDCKGAGDIKGDGYLDVVAATEHELAWYEYPTWAKHAIAYGTNFTTDMQVADINNDRVPDVIVPDGEHGKLVWYENPRGTVAILPPTPGLLIDRLSSNDLCSRRRSRRCER